MRRIHYVDSAVTTGDAIAEAVLAYARELARADTSDTVDIPILLDEGGFGRSQLLIGPASQVVVTPGDPDLDEVVDAALVADLDGRRRRLVAAHAATPSSPSGAGGTRGVAAPDPVDLDFEG